MKSTFKVILWSSKFQHFLTLHVSKEKLILQGHPHWWYHFDQIIIKCLFFLDKQYIDFCEKPNPNLSAHRPWVVRTHVFLLETSL